MSASKVISAIVSFYTRSKTKSTGLMVVRFCKNLSYGNRATKAWPSTNTRQSLGVKHFEKGFNPIIIQENLQEKFS